MTPNEHRQTAADLLARVERERSTLPRPSVERIRIVEEMNLDLRRAQVHAALASAPEPPSARTAEPVVTFDEAVGIAALDALNRGDLDRAQSITGFQAGGVLADVDDEDQLAATGEPAEDVVKRPSHYTAHPSGVECIEITRDLPFVWGNAIKYLWRAELKNGREDLEKALQYIRWIHPRHARMIQVTIDGDGSLRGKLRDVLRHTPPRTPLMSMLLATVAAIKVGVDGSTPDHVDAARLRVESQLANESENS